MSGGARDYTDMMQVAQPITCDAECEVVIHALTLRKGVIAGVVCEAISAVQVGDCFAVKRTRNDRVR